MPVPEARVQIQVDGEWVDITDDVKGGAELVHTRGRSGEGARVDRASVALTLKSPDGKYYPRHPMSPYYGRLGRNTPMRHLAGGSPMNLRIGDVAAARLTTPDHSSLDITGDLDVRLDAAFDEWPTTGDPREVMAKWLTTGDQRSWMLTVWRSRILLYWTADGTTTLSRSSPAAVTARPGQRVAIRATLDVNNGASGHTATFYTAPTIAGPWTVLGAPVVTAGTTGIFSGSGPVEIGDLTGITFATAQANVFAAEIRNGIGGTVVANPDLTAQAAGATGFTDGAGRTWSTAGGAEITSHRVRSVVEVPTWAPRWTVNGTDMDVAVQGAGVLRRLSQGQKALESTLRRRVPSYGPLAYWPMEDEAEATWASSPIEGVRPLVTTKARFGVDDTLGGSSALPEFESGGSFYGPVPPPAESFPTEWSLHMVYTVEETPAADAEFLSWTSTGTIRRWKIFQRAGVATVIGWDRTGDLAINQVIAVGADVFEGWNRLHFQVSAAGSTVTWRLTWININGPSGSYTDTYSGSTGRVTTIRTAVGADGLPNFGLRVGHLAVMPTALTDAYTFADHGFTGETAGARAVRLAQEERLPFALIGDAVRSTPMGPQRPDTLLNLLSQCEESDGGILYEDRTRLGMVYRTRSSFYSQTPALVLPYSQLVQPFEPVDDDTFLRNDVTRSRIGGSSARAVQETGPLSVLPPPDGIGVYDEAVELSVATDEQLTDLASWALHMGTWNEARYKQIRILLHKHSGLIEAAAQLDVGDLVRITGLPSYLPPGPVDLMVEGYRETLSNLSWELILNCSPGGPWTVGVVEDPVLGRADTDGTQLAVAVSDTATVWPITVTAGPSWITTAAFSAMFPFGVTASGEQVTVTRITGVAEDAFGRTVASGWGTADSGQTWALLGGPASDYAVTGGTGRHIATAVSTIRHTLLPVTAADQDIQFDWSIDALPTGDNAWVFPMARATDATHMYVMRIQIATTGAMTLTLRKRNGAETQLGSSYATGLTCVPGTWYTARLAVVGSSLTGKLWQRGTPEPAAWQLSSTDTDLTAPGSVGCRSLLSGAATNALPLTFQFDNVYCGPQAMTVTRSANGITKSHPAGTPLSLTNPMRAAL
ncbi:hypothetical protein ABZ488_04480 [Streptomyces griseus]|uniref:hypothetical protein n=1 Tax=Streptomyces griseus TaxID=1911 RepID=UPI0033E93436